MWGILNERKNGKDETCRTMGGGFFFLLIFLRSFYLFERIVLKCCGILCLKDTHTLTLSLSLSSPPSPINTAIC